MNVATPTPSTPPPNPTPQPPARPRLVPRLNLSGGIPPWVWWVVGLLVLAAGGFFLFFWRGQLEVQVSPTTADVRIGEQGGIGSLQATLWPGTYHIQSEAPGYIPYDREVTISQGDQQTVNVELRTLPAPTKLLDKPVQFLSLDVERASLLYLVPSAKRIERLEFSTLTKPVVDAITPDRFSNVTEFRWSPDHQLAFYREGSALKQYDFNRYDLINQSVSDWPTEVVSVDWRPDGEKVAYAYHNAATGERTLIRANKHNDEVERIFNFGTTAITEPEVRWSPDGKMIAVLEQNLFLLDVFSAELKPLNIGTPINAMTWSPASDRILFETEGGQLGLVRMDGTRESFELAGPLNRVVFTPDGASLIVASGRGLDSKLERIELATGTKTPYALVATADLEPVDLLLGPEGKLLFFTSGGLPYALPLDDGTYPTP